MLAQVSLLCNGHKDLDVVKNTCEALLQDMVRLNNIACGNQFVENKNALPSVFCTVGLDEALR